MTTDLVVPRFGRQERIYLTIQRPPLGAHLFQYILIGSLPAVLNLTRGLFYARNFWHYSALSTSGPRITKYSALGQFHVDIRQGLSTDGQGHVSMMTTSNCGTFPRHPFHPIFALPPGCCSFWFLRSFSNVGLVQPKFAPEKPMERFRFIVVNSYFDVCSMYHGFYKILSYKTPLVISSSNLHTVTSIFPFSRLVIMTVSDLPLELPIAKAFTTMGEPSEAKLSLKDLPTELKHQIYDYCPVNARLCLKMCCRKFRDETPGTVRGLYEVINRTIDFGNAKFEALCVDDTYIGLKTERHVCSVCQLVHRAEEFTESELKENPRNRVCEGSQRLLDLIPSSGSTPGISSTYQELHQRRNIRVRLTSLYDEVITFRPVEDKSGQWTMKMTVPMQYPNSPAWKDDLRHLLQNFPVCACPHLLSSEPQLLQAISSYDDNRYADQAFVVCDTCNTMVKFTIPARPAGTGFHTAVTSGFEFHIERKLGRLGESAVDPRWKAQSLPPPRT